MATTGLEFLAELGLDGEIKGVCTGREWQGGSLHRPLLESTSPVDGQVIGKLAWASEDDYRQTVKTANEAFGHWRQVPAPKRGELVRQLGNAFRDHKAPLGQLVAYEMGKSLQEGLGEVQEMIDICDFAVGLSRQLHGFTMHSERPKHRMYEQYHPLGVVGIISAFNFPCAVWAWNSMIATVCGDVTLWKPSEKTPLTAVACFKIMEKVLAANDVPEGVFSLVVGDVKDVGEPLVTDRSVPLISATGSTRMGKIVAEKVGSRLGKTILELGGNNAIILTEHSDLKLAIPAIVFGAVGTCGQRCTTTRRLIIHSSQYNKVKDMLTKAYASLKVGNPLDESNHVGPLIDKEAVATMQAALKTAAEQGGEVLTGGEVLDGAEYSSGCYVAPAIVEANHDMAVVKEETFAPILYLMKYGGDVTNAIQSQNDVTQGLSSAVFTDNLLEAEKFLSAAGSDCGIANVNIGTSGAEIGGAFGGEKDTGGGRESGSDAWKAYMRRQTNTINYGKEMPLAQGIKFDLG